MTVMTRCACGRPRYPGKEHICAPRVKPLVNEPQRFKHIDPRLARKLLSDPRTQRALVRAFRGRRGS